MCISNSYIIGFCRGGRAIFVLSLELGDGCGNISFCLGGFLGADAAMRLDRLFCIEVITGKLPQKAQLYVKFVNYAIIVIFLAGMIGYGLWLSYTTRLRTFQESRALVIHG